MPRKTTKVARMAIKAHDSFRVNVEEKIKKEGFLNSVDLISQLTGMEVLLIKILTHQNCYHGFNPVDSDGHATTEDQPSWRVSYIIKG